MEELFKKFLSGVAPTLFGAGAASLIPGVSVKDALGAMGGANALSSFLKSREDDARPSGQGQAMKDSSGINMDAFRQELRFNPRFNAQSGDDYRRSLAVDPKRGFDSGIMDLDNGPLAETNLSDVEEADTRGIMAALGDIITGDGGRESALKQLFMPDPEGDPSALRKYGPGLLALLAAGKLGGAFDPVDPRRNQVQQFGGVTGQSLLNQNPSAYRIGVPSIARGFAGGGGIDPADFPRRTGGISGPGTGTSDDIPAMLSDGEFVMTAKAVKGMGNGNRERGIRNMYQVMDNLEGMA